MQQCRISKFFREDPRTPLKGEVVGKGPKGGGKSGDKGQRGGARVGRRIIDVILHYHCFNFRILICK